MPSIVTHHLFAKECLTGYESLIDKDVYYIFAQSFDNLAYYHFFKVFGNKMKMAGYLGQRTKTNEYFLNILDYIKDKGLENDQEVMGYLLGSICHYALDSVCHPFIIYESGSTDVSRRYRGGHEKMEVMIDAIMYEKKMKRPLYKDKIADMLLPKKKFNKNLEDTLDKVFDKTFGFKEMSKIYQESYETGHFLVRFFVTDRTGIKKMVYRIKDLFGRGKMYQYLSFHIKKLDNSFLNLEHEEWCYPALKEKTSRKSFLELYDEAMKFATHLFNVSLKYLHGEIDKDEVNKEFKDLSYVTGLDWHLENEMKYFKY